MLLRIARRQAYNLVISVEREEAECCDFRIPSLHLRTRFGKNSGIRPYCIRFRLSQ